MNKVSDFLEAFHGKNKIHFRVIQKGSSPYNLYGTYEELSDKLHKYNQEGYDIYFVVNSGGTHNYEINRINAVYIDFDRGKNDSKQYFPIEEVEKFKNDCLNKINQFELEPSYIVETRNGIHVYWLVENGTTEQFEYCQEQLISFFGSDPAVKTVERVMRVPDFYWSKDKNNIFMCNVLTGNKHKYIINDITNHLPNVEINPVSVKKRGDNIDTKQMTNKYSYKDNITFIKNGLTNYNGAEVLQKVIMANRLKLNIISSLNLVDGVFGGLDRDNISTNVSNKTPKNPYLMDETQVNTHDEVYAFLKQQDLKEYLGIDDTHFKCVFHDDKSPSASIFQDPSTGCWWYKCHSPECQLNKIYTKINNESKCIISIKAKDIIAITERFLKCSRPKALRFLRKVYNINFIETEWQKEQKEILDENIRMLTVNYHDLEENYPTLFKRLKQNKHHLVELILFAKEHVYTENFTDSNNNAVFFASVKRIIELFGLSQHSSGTKITSKLAIFAFLGMLFKLKEDEVPDEYLKTAKHFAAKNKQYNTIGFYSVPSYTEEVLVYAEEMARLFVEKNMSMKGLTRELLVRTFGEEFANEIYPQTSKKKMTKKSQIRTEQIHKITMDLIEKNGYALEKNIVDNMSKIYDSVGQTYSKEQLFIQIKKSLQEMLDTYGLMRIRCNNKIKALYWVASDGYPFIIVKKL